MAEIEKKPEESLPIWPVSGQNGRIVTAPLETLWKEAPKKSNRI